MAHEPEPLLPSPIPTNSNPNNRSMKRKRIAEEDGSLDGQAKQRTADLIPLVIESDHPVTHWVLTHSWPENLGQRDAKMTEPLTRKRPSTSSHRTPTMARMATHGIYMTNSSMLKSESEELCQTYLLGDHQTSRASAFTEEEFNKYLKQAVCLTESQIQRDITPWLVPSINVLKIKGELQNTWIGEEVGQEWIRCATLGSKIPKPDYTAGLPLDSFTAEEMEKLQNYATPTTPAHFTHGLCFPFLICEVKSGERGLAEADRQNMHAASIALRAIVSLYQEAYGSSAPHRVQELMGQVLVFTVSHDNTMVRLYGHFALAEPTAEGGLKFFRHAISEFSFKFERGPTRIKAYNFVSNVYEKFAVEHRKRIKDAVEQLPVPPVRTGPSATASDLTMTSTEDSQPASSQGNDEFATPVEPASVAQKREVVRLREQVAQLQLQLEQLQQQPGPQKE